MKPGKESASAGFKFKDGKDDGDASFTLNGRKLKLIGVNRHEHWVYMGRAVPDRHQKRDADTSSRTQDSAPYAAPTTPRTPSSLTAATSWDS